MQDHAAGAHLSERQIDPKIVPSISFRHTNSQAEPAEYLARREELRLAEMDLMRQRERVAEFGRQLPAGAEEPARKHIPARSDTYR